MLDILRSRAQSTLVQALVIIIALVFIFWGVGTNLGNRKNVVATVNGAEISLVDFQRLYERTLDDYRQQFGGQIPDGLLESLNIKGNVLSQMIQGELMRQGGKTMGLAVSQEETRNEIKSMDAFEENGQFSMERYKLILSQNRMSPTSFEEGLRSDLLTRQVVRSVEQFATVTAKELAAWLALGEEELKLAWTAFRGRDFEDKVNIDEAALAAWYEEHKENYREEPKIVLRYLFFPFSDDLSAVAVDEDAIKTRYEADRARYEQPEQRQARHILLRLKETSTPEEKQQVRTKAEEILAKARAGEDFAALARRYSEDPAKENGGDLGFFTRGRMVPAFEEKVFSMQPGEISDIVGTSFGLHIIRLETIRPQSITSFEDARAGIVRELRQELVKPLSFRRATTAYEEIMRAGSLDKFQETRQDSVNKSELFSKSAPPAGILANPVLLDKAFALKQGELSPIVELDTGYAILYVQQQETADIPPLQSIQGKVAGDYKQGEAVNLARQAASSLLAKAGESGQTLVTAADLADVPLHQTDFLKRNQGGQGNDLPAPLVQQAFTLAWNKQLPESIFTDANTFYVYGVLERRQGEQSVSEEEKTRLSEQLHGTVKNRLMNNWLTGLQQRADVWTNDQLLK